MTMTLQLRRILLQRPLHPLPRQPMQLHRQQEPCPPGHGGGQEGLCPPGRPLRAWPALRGPPGRARTGRARAQKTDIYESLDKIMFLIILTRFLAPPRKTMQNHSEIIPKSHF